MSPAEAEGVVLVIGCGTQPYREYLLASAASRHPLWLLTADEPTWQRGYVAGATVVDLEDRGAVVAAAAELARRTVVKGVLSWDEALIVAAAQAAAALGVAGPGPKAIEGCRDKVRSRTLLTAAGIAQPDFEFAGDEAAALAAAERIGFPVVVKPRAGGASAGVMRADDVESAREAFRVADDASFDGPPAYFGGALVEEFLAGPEISVDAAVVDGEYLPLFLARKTVGMHPFFEELGHVVDADDELLADAGLMTMLARAHRAVGFGSGITHTEVKLTRSGPVIVEINGRLGGDLVPLLGRFATGIEPGAVAVEVALGLRPEIPGRPRGSGRRCAGVRFGYPRQDCVVDTVSVPECRSDNGVLAAAALVGPGERLMLPPAGFISRHAYVICAGADPDDCAAVLDKALSDVRLTARPLLPSAVRG